jgi:hypothetical protein
MLEELRKEVAEKEEFIKIQLAREIQRLEEEKHKIENDIQGMYLFIQVIPYFLLFLASKCKFLEFLSFQCLFTCVQVFCAVIRSSIY